MVDLRHGMYLCVHSTLHSYTKINTATIAQYMYSTYPYVCMLGLAQTILHFSNMYACWIFPPEWTQNYSCRLQWSLCLFQ